jgi:hypothetical protein
MAFGLFFIANHLKASFIEKASPMAGLWEEHVSFLIEIYETPPVVYLVAYFIKV